MKKENSSNGDETLSKPAASIVLLSTSREPPYRYAWTSLRKDDKFPDTKLRGSKEREFKEETEGELELLYRTSKFPS
jgi:hypothetical protein